MQRASRQPLRILLCLLLAFAELLLLAKAVISPMYHGPTDNAGPDGLIVPDFQIPIGKVAKPLPYRIVSFHRGRADKNLIKLAAQLGFNGVQFQIEGSNQLGIKEFADRDAAEHLVDYCHSLGMKVTLWVHELSDLPGPWMPDYLGPETADNDALFSYLDNRYEWILAKAVPNVDGLVLSVVETQVRATRTAIFLRICDLLRKKCDKYHKSLVIRTFVWTPEEFSNVMAGVNQLPKDAVIMSKCVPQDWQLRGANAAEIGTVGGRAQIIEFDAEGEYFLHNTVANCMPDLLKRQFDYAVSKNAAGICVRVDRFTDSVLFQPSEVNLWTLGMLAAGASDSTDDIWNRWATYRYGAPAAQAIITTLKPTESVIAEALSIGPFTHGDTRKPAPLPDEDLFSQNWQNWRWDKSYAAAHDQAERGDPQFIAAVAEQKKTAMQTADQCLRDLQKVRPFISPVEYMILYTKLLTNRVQLDIRTQMELISLEYRALRHGQSYDQRDAFITLINDQLTRLRAIAASLNRPPVVVDYLRQRWYLGVPEGIDPEFLLYWAHFTQELIDQRRPPLPPAQQTNPIVPPFAPAIPSFAAPTSLPAAPPPSNPPAPPPP